MDSRTGKNIRGSRVLGSTGRRTLVVAYSHGLLLGPKPGVDGWADVLATAEAVSRADALMISPGLVRPLESYFMGRDRPSLVVHLDWTSFSRTTLPYAQGSQRSIATIEQVVAAGADAVMTYLLIGYDDPEREANEIARNAAVARECERFGVIHIIEPRHALERLRPELKLDLDVMRLYCRISAEVGADAIKCVWPGSVQAMADIVESALVPVLVAGGARDSADPQRSTVMAREAMAAGVAGLVFGRTIYQSPRPESVVDELRAVLAGGRSE